MTHKAACAVLESLSQELARQAERIDRLEHEILPLLACHKLSRAQLHALQDLDLLCQSLRDLSRYTSALGAQAGPDDRLNTTGCFEVLHLRDLADRLGGGEGHLRHDSGEVDLF
ncbi:hypothetical protein C8N32_1096 [Rhodovulum imhoffii]|uniref:Uncharacterized protein n=1 Tax=Rhodovulum imhoffii TaxID=365340 RepID=A0A2T5BRG5_9RHOB|nr:hypothetical protein [Rhodovulum imhoffii]MBK5933997.1 hypothetical protein [Rhodovulum imhoffii]PTN01882.1 hypothetical protein C8N32_1096 [Rhodovulum imhoffii]